MLLERDGELGLLADLLAGVESSGGKVVLVRGEAGIGKSSLVREFVDRHGGEAHVYFGSCDDLLTPQPLGPFWDIARDEPSLAGPLKEVDRPGVLRASLDLLSGSLRSNILVIEDTQWADEATLDAIKYVGRRIGRTNGLLLLTYRDGEVDYDHPLRGVIGDLSPDSVVRIQLGGLSSEAVASMVDDTDLDPEEVLAGTGGNPFLVTEMASADGEVVPSSVQDSVMARVGKLSSESREMLQILSVVPEPVARLEVLRLTGAAEDEFAECERRGLLGVEGELVAFRHELIRRAVEASLTGSERMATNRKVLESLPPETDPARLVHHAREANDIARLLELAPRAARAAAAVGSHREAVDHFRQLTSHIDLLDPDTRGSILDEWAREEFLQDNISEAINLNGLALIHYRELGDRTGESGVLAQAAHFYENSGRRHRAEHLARQAVDVLGVDPDGSDLARALEVNAYLQWMAMNVTAMLELVDRTLEAAGRDVDHRIVIRSLTHKGVVASIANYPDGRASLDEARDRAEAAGEWYEECRALFNHAWAAAEFRDLPVASDYAQRAIASAVRHELSGLESYATAIYARVLELKGEWGEAEDLARDQLDRAAISQMVALPILGMIEARTGRATAQATLTKAWELSAVADEFQRLAPTGIAIAEHAWISGFTDTPITDIGRILELGLEKGFIWSPGSIALWLWKLGELSEAPKGIAEPYRLVIEGEPMAAAEMWSTIGCPYERGIALAHGDQAAQLEALDVFDTLGATAVAAKLRKALRDQGVSVSRGKGRTTREHGAGLTARQAEVLLLLDEGLSNIEIADRLFVSPRTVEHHVSAVLSKLDSSTREKAVETAAQQGLLPTR
jgi:DNA-binding CsgD family transcriptional regulator/tetratricopeptide (TPR) repeat protein